MKTLAMHILIIGRRNSGKTALVCRILDALQYPAVYVRSTLGGNGEPSDIAKDANTCYDDRGCVHFSDGRSETIEIESIAGNTIYVEDEAQRSSRFIHMSRGIGREPVCILTYSSTLFCDSSVIFGADLICLLGNPGTFNSYCAFIYNRYITRGLNDRNNIVPTVIRDKTVWPPYSPHNTGPLFGICQPSKQHFIATFPAHLFRDSTADKFLGLLIAISDGYLGPGARPRNGSRPPRQLSFVRIVCRLHYDVLIALARSLAKNYGSLARPKFNAEVFVALLQ